MDITNRLLAMDKSLTLHNEGEWSTGVSEYSAFNDAGIECEVGEYLYGLVRILKPKRILETGTHVGIGASYLGMGLKDNKKGKLDTIEFLSDIYKQAVNRISTMELNDYVICHYGDAKDFIPPEDWQGSNETIQDVGLPQPRVQYDMILLDTEPQTRFAEFEKFYPYLREGGYIFIHDLFRHMHQVPNVEHGFAWPFGKITPFITEKVGDGSVRPFHFETPRGLSGFYKVSEKDFKFTKKT